MRRPRYRDLPIAAKLLVPFLISMLVWGVLGTQVLLSGTAREASGVASTRLAVALEVGRSTFSTAGARLIETVRFAAHTEGLGEALAQRDSVRLTALIEGIAANAGHESLSVVDATGSVVVTVRLESGNPVASTGGRADLAEIRHAARGDVQTESTIVLDGDRIRAVVAAKDLGGAVVGAVVASERAEQIIADMAAGTGVRMTLFSSAGTRIAGAGAPVPFRSVERDGLRSGYGDGSDRVETLYAPLTASGRVLGVLGMGIRASDAVPGGSARTNALGLLVAAAVLLALAIGWRASRSVSVPVGDLVAATKALEQGSLSTRAEVATRDEIGRLAESFNVMAAELQASHEELERKVAERTAELERVNAELARVSEAKSQFLATMSHELRTPLNAVIGFADFLGDPAFGPPSTKDVRRIARDIHASGTHLLTLINDLLDLAKIEAGKVEFEMRPVRLRDVVADVEAVCRSLAGAADLRLVVKIPARLPHVRADAGRVRQVLLNLIGNAIKFTPAGGSVTVSAAEDHGAVVVCVADTGPGMSPEEAAVIFEPFERAAGARGVEGAGLGLALTRRFVELHGGTIAVDSDPGRGSAFRFTLPLSSPPKRRASDLSRDARATA